MVFLNIYKLYKLLRRAYHRDLDAILELIKIYNYNSSLQRKYIKMAAQEGHLESMQHLGIYYCYKFKKHKKIKYLESMEKYCNMAFEKNDDNGIISLIRIFIKINNIEKIEYYSNLLIDDCLLKNKDEVNLIIDLEDQFKNDYIDIFKKIKLKCNHFKLLKYSELKIDDKIEECIICYEEKQMYYTRCIKHSICFDCLLILYNKPCPMCRQ